MEETAPAQGETPLTGMAKWWDENPSVLLICFVLLDLFQEDNLMRLVAATLAALIAGGILSRFLGLRRRPRLFLSVIGFGFLAEVAAIPFAMFGLGPLGYASFLLACFLISLAYCSAEFKSKKRKRRE